MKALQLSQVESQPIYSLEKGNKSVTQAVSWVVLHLKVWHIIWKRKQTKIALLRYCSLAFASQEHFQINRSSSVLRKISDWIQTRCWPLSIFEWYMVVEQGPAGTQDSSVLVLLFYNMCLDGGLNVLKEKFLLFFIGYAKLIKYNIQIFL